MAVKSPEKELAALAEIRSDPAAPAAVLLLKSALAGKNNLVAAEAAVVIQHSNQTAFLPELAAALARFFIPGTDKGCPAKTALTEALYTLGHADAAVFLPGVRHVQMEGSYGPPVDAAVDVRGFSALGLARAGYRDLPTEMAQLLADKEPAARQMAVRALAYAGAESATPLLRFKALSGDPEPNVTAECFSALMQLSPRLSLPFVGQFVARLDSCAAAAMAIGECRSLEGFEFLRNAWDRSFDPATRLDLLPALAMSRRPEAVAFLLERIEQDRPHPASAAVSALAIFKHDPTVAANVTTAAKTNGDPAVITAAQKHFPRQNHE